MTGIDSIMKAVTSVNMSSEALPPVELLQSSNGNRDSDVQTNNSWNVADIFFKRNI